MVFSGCILFFFSQASLGAGGCAALSPSPSVIFWRALFILTRYWLQSQSNSNLVSVNSQSWNYGKGSTKGAVLKFDFLDLSRYWEQNKPELQNGWSVEFFTWQLPPVFGGGRKPISAGESPAFHKGFEELPVVSCWGMELQCNTRRRAVPWQGGTCSGSPSGAWPGGCGLWHEGTRREGSSLNPGKLLRNAEKELSVLSQSMKEGNLCTQIVPIMSDSLSGLNPSCLFLSVGEMYVAGGF